MPPDSDDTEIHAMLDQAARDLQVEVGKLRENVAKLLGEMHNSPCEPVVKRIAALEREQDMARGAIKAGIFGLGIPAIIISAVALWRVLTAK